MQPAPELLNSIRRERIERARRMSPEERLITGPRLFTLAVECMRAGIRLQYPEADEPRVRDLVRERLERMRRKDERAFHGPA